MDKTSLQDLLAKLQREATEALPDDPKSRESLSGTMQDINRLVETDESLPDRLERIAVQFEADHPTLAASARRLVDLLGEVGI
jgi:hypothetical protein